MRFHIFTAVGGLVLALCSARGVWADESAIPSVTDFKPLAMNAELTAKPIVRWWGSDHTGSCEVWAQEVRGNQLEQVTLAFHRGRARDEVIFAFAIRGEFVTVRSKGPATIRFCNLEAKMNRGEHIGWVDRVWELPWAHEVLDPRLK
jgi:hypothetical protein